MQESVSMHKSPTHVMHSRMNQARSGEERQETKDRGQEADGNKLLIYYLDSLIIMPNFLCKNSISHGGIIIITYRQVTIVLKSSMFIIINRASLPSQVSGMIKLKIEEWIRVWY